MDFKVQGDNLGLDEDEFLELVELFTETSSAELNKLKSAIEQQDAQAVVEAAHSIKGSSGNIGFQNIYETAREVEANARKNIFKGASEAVKSIKTSIDRIEETLKKA